MRRNAFTFLEILIAIAVMTIMLTMIGLSFKSSELTAKANNVITNMLTISMAFNAAYMQDLDKINKEAKDYANGKQLGLETIAEYFDNLKTEDYSKYDIIYYSLDHPRKGWWVRYKLKSDASIRAELEDRVISEPSLEILSYRTEGKIDKADQKNISTTNLYLILKAR